MDMLELLKLCLSSHASDLHILPKARPLMRVHGDLVDVKAMDLLSAEETHKLIYSVMTEQQQRDFERDLVHEMALIIPGIGNFRVSTLHQMNGVAAVFRVISEKVPTFEELALPSVLKRLLVLSHGLILIAGPTGSGKSTTMAAMLDFINAIRTCHIITIEDPIEYIYTNKKSAVTQIQVGRDTPNMETALRASLRQDPDVIMIGELRDLETIRLALTAAETGHLVLSSLHASSAPLAISRMVDIFPMVERPRVRNILAETIQSILCQTLVKRVAGGRVAAFEIMFATPAIRHLIRQDMAAQMSSTIQTSGDVGMCTLEQSLNDLIQKQIITPGVARSAVLNQDAFQL